MFVFLSPRDRRHRCDIEYFSEHNEYALPIRNCRTAIFNLVNETQITPNSSNCCQDMIVFKDLGNLHISDDDTKATALKTDDSIDGWHADGDRVWYELDTFVKGFKDVMVKGKTIWE